MMWHVAAVFVLILVGLPLVVLPSWIVAVLAFVAAGLCAGGIAALSVPVLTAGASLAVIEYALALSISDGPPDFVTAMVLAVALFLLLELVSFMGRLHGAAVAAPVMRSMIRYWLAIAGAGAGVVIVLTAAAAAVRLAVPVPSYPAAAAAGALGAFVAAVGVLKLATKSRDTATGEAAEIDADRPHEREER